MYIHKIDGILQNIYFQPVTSRLSRKVFGYKELIECAVDEVVIHPSEVIPMSRPVFLEGQIERISGVHEFSAGLGDEISKAIRESQEHTETRAYKLKDICFHNKTLSNYTHFKRLSYSQFGPSIPFSPEIQIDRAALCSSPAGIDYFAHLVFDDFSTALLAEDFASPYMAPPKFTNIPHPDGYKDLIGLNVQTVQSAFFKELWLFQDHSLNRNRRTRLQKMRANLSTGKSPLKQISYLKRGNNASLRLLTNEDELVDCLISRGVDVLDPMELSVTELKERLNGNQMTLGVEGSQLVHGLMHTRKGGYILCIQPPDRFNAIYRPLGDAVGLNWAFVVGSGNQRNFSVSIPEVLKTIDCCLS